MWSSPLRRRGWPRSKASSIRRSVASVGAASRWLHLHTVRNMIDTGTKTTNLVAAVPSLHAGFATLVAITLWPSVPRWCRPFLAFYPVLMGLALVATGEHYVVDILLGVGYAFAAHFSWNYIERWWQRRKDARASDGRGVRGQSRPAEPPGCWSIRLARSTSDKVSAPSEGRHPSAEPTGSASRSNNQSVIRSATAGLMRLACAAGAATATNDAPSAAAPSANRRPTERERKLAARRRSPTC